MKTGDCRKSASPQHSGGHFRCLAIGPANRIPPRQTARPRSRHRPWQPDNRRRDRPNVSVRAKDDPGAVSDDPGSRADGPCGPPNDPGALRILPCAAPSVPCGQPSRPCAAADASCGAQNVPGAVANGSSRGPEASRNASVVPCGRPIPPCAGSNDPCTTSNRPCGPTSAGAKDLLIPPLTSVKPPSNQERN